MPLKPTNLTILLLGLLPLTVSAALPVKMKLLVIAATGLEPSFAAIQSFLDHLGAPYETVFLGQGQNLPTLDDGTTGNYQGIILVTGNLGVCDPVCRNTLAPDDWARLDAYTANYSVRTVSYYTYPESKYGLRLRDVLLTTSGAPVVTFTPDAAQIFPYLRQDQGIPIAGLFMYLADPVAAPGEITTPLLQMGDATVAALHTTADGREYLALTLDNSPVLRHSLLLNYGLISWVTKGVFLGERRIYLNPQADDMFLADNLFTDAGGPCTPTKFILSPSNPASPDCLKLRISGTDLANVREWQAGWNTQPQTNLFKVTIAYNGLGVKPDSDDLMAEAQRFPGDFYWVSHTYSHKDLDCYTMSSGQCQPATYDESAFELRQNFQAAQQFGILADPVSVITPAISGLQNADFLNAAFDWGVRYLVSDMSMQDELPSTPNTGVITSLNANLLFVPRRATNVFYNASTPFQGNGSESDEYNYFFGPDGIVRVGGQGGPPFFTANQTYDQIIDRESDSLLQLMLQYEPYPCMFHQTNFFSYQGSRSVFTDVLDRTLRKFTSISTLPVLSLPPSEIGTLLRDRMDWLASGGQAVLNPGKSITISVVNSANIPITGVCVAQCTDYGGERHSSIALGKGARLTIPLALNNP